jgi:adenylate kinase family enzyme
VRVAEGFHEKWIGKIADAILAQRGTTRIVAVAGPSSSGKTTFIKRLVAQLLVDGMRPHMISLDDYWRNEWQSTALRMASRARSMRARKLPSAGITLRRS